MRSISCGTRVVTRTIALLFTLCLLAFSMPVGVTALDMESNSEVTTMQDFSDGLDLGAFAAMQFDGITTQDQRCAEQMVDEGEYDSHIESPDGGVLPHASTSRTTVCASEGSGAGVRS